MRELEPEDFALVEAIARSLEKRCRLPWQELQSLGWLGLLRAADSFDPSRGVEFGSWATLKIRGEIRDRLRVEFGRTQLGTTSRMKWHPQACGDLEALDTLVRYSTRDREEVEARDLCEWALSHLAPRYQQVFRMRFWEGHTEQEIAEAMNVCEGRISQILRRGREVMRRKVEVEFKVPGHEEQVDEPLLAL